MDMIALIARGVRLPSAERWRAIEALLVLATVRVLFVVLPFRIAMTRLGLRTQAQGGGGQGAGEQDVAGVIDSVGRAVSRAAKIAPFRAVCLQQALAAAVMLRRRGLQSEVHFGVAKLDDILLSAHAWSVCRGIVVTGRDGMERFTPLAVFF